MIRLGRLIGLWLLTAALAATSHAHQQKVALVDILVNPRSGNIEVVHSFILHDAEAALASLSGITGDLYTDPQVQAAFSDYAVSLFELSTGVDDALPLRLLGFEVEAGRLLVYQEAPTPEGLHMLAVRAGALRDVWDDQTNTVNIRSGDTLRTLVFTAGDGAKVAVLKSTP